MVMLSRKPVGAGRARRRRAKSSYALGRRLSQIVEAARPSSALAVGRRSTGARGFLMLGDASATQRFKRRARGVGWKEGNFPPCKLLKTHETELESNQPLPFGGRRGNGGDRLAEPKGSRRLLPRRRSRQAARNAERRNFPIRKPLKRHKMAKESRRPSLLPPARGDVQGNTAVSRSRARGLPESARARNR